jgi:hypothetical protein
MYTDSTHTHTCTHALRAILDDERTHKRLVAYYKYFGFVPVCEVRSRLADLPHLLVWGG